MTEPKPLTSAEARDLLPARIDGPEVPVRRLWDAAASGEAAADAAVVLARLDADAWTRWRAAGIGAVVAPVADVDALTDVRADDPARWAVADTRLALARLSRRLDARPAIAAVGVHPSAVVDPSARLGARVAVGPLAVVGPDAVVEDDAVIGAGAFVGARARVGAGSVLRERVVVEDGVVVGRRCWLQAGAVIGGDGFGFAPGPRGAERIHHLGTVVLGDDVEVGANACIDRATLGATVIGPRCKIDNLVQIGHNVRVGADALIAGQTGIAGSTQVGDRVVIGGAAGVSDHLEIGDDARIAGGAGVTKNVPAGDTWGGYPAQPVRRWIRERYLIGRLEAIWAFVKGRT